MKPITNVYIDGFNFYYGCVKGTPYRWLNFSKLCMMLLPGPLIGKPMESPNMVEVFDTKEKGSDVNQASYLLVDGFKREYQVGIIISNDSDLAETIKLASSELGLEIGVLHPHHTSVKELSQVSKFYRPIRQKVLKACLFPPVLKDADGTIHKPERW